MKTIKNEKTIFVDIDDTLVMWSWKGINESTITYKDPYSNQEFEVLPNIPNINLLKEKHKRGYTVVVWSQGGYAHAAAVIKALKLCSKVDYVMTKPSAYIDDKVVCEWFPKRIWLPPHVRYKQAL